MKTVVPLLWRAQVTPAKRTERPGPPAVIRAGMSAEQADDGCGARRGSSSMTSCQGHAVLYK
ncbi:hypothetical protein [Breoghania sp. L-A4]|uniref:hypothetical protein n=1 Tax=Breoghania sp. L-A4 TaxID=2304600 RepID=UPI000E358C81|nr:hypothetical protein [Breoghania sp. L-A4]AXS39972.1 hypothetical protein D1F64_07745 [Breoghania sp. L-A4]